MSVASAALDPMHRQIAGSLTGPVTKWKPEQFFDTAPLEAVLKDIGKR